MTFGTCQSPRVHVLCSPMKPCIRKDIRHSGFG